MFTSVILNTNVLIFDLAIFDKESGNIHCLNETSSRVSETSNQIKPCEFHVKHCSQSESNLSGFYCVIHIFVMQRVESILKR